MLIKKIIFFSVFAFIIINADAQSFQWVKQMGGTADDKGQAISTDASNNIITIGTFTGTVDFDPGAGIANLTSYDSVSSGMFIQKLDNNGNLLWVKQIIGNATYNSVEPQGSVIDAAGNIYITGYYNNTGSIDMDPGSGVYILPDSLGSSNGFILKLNSAGNFIFAKQFMFVPRLSDYIMGFPSSSGGVYPSKITIDSVGNIYSTGRFTGNVDFDPSSSSFHFLYLDYNASGWGSYVSKLDQNGNFVWAKAFIGQDSLSTAFISSTSIQVDGTGNVYTTGDFHDGPADMDPGFGTYLLQVDSSSQWNNFLSKLDVNGNFVWGETINSSAGGNSALKLDVSGNIYYAGYYPALTKLNSSGNIIWSKYENDFPYSITLDDAGNIYTSGEYPASNGGNATISEYDSSGVLIWRNSINGSWQNAGNSVAIDYSGNVYATGVIDTTTALVGSGTGSFTLTSHGLLDIFVCKLSTTQEVWPGDVDNNNNVDNNDLLPIGLLYGQTGTSRTTVSNVWQAETSTDWGTNEPNGTDIKHADCNGDGTIDNNDTLAINLNFSSVHAIVVSPNNEKTNAPDIYFVTSSNTYNAGDWVDAELWLGNSTTPVPNLYGIAFNVMYPSYLIQPGTESITFPSSWLGIPGTDAIKVSKIDALATTAYGAETRINHFNANGYGKIADFHFQISTTLSSSATLNLSITNYMADDAAGLPVVFNPQPLMVNVAVGVNELNNYNSDILISPNPFTSQTTISFSQEQKNTTIKITDVLGNIVNSQKATGKSVVLDMSGFAKGIYFVQITDDNKNVVNRKIVLQ